jgi:hypothetical protein
MQRLHPQYSIQVNDISLAVLSNRWAKFARLNAHLNMDNHRAPSHPINPTPLSSMISINRSIISNPLTSSTAPDLNQLICDESEQFEISNPAPASLDFSQFDPMLCELLRANKVPVYEKNSQTFAALRELQNYRARQQKLAENTIADWKQRTEHYKARAKQLQTQLTAVSIQPLHLSNTAQSQLLSLSYAANDLQLKNSRNNSFIQAILTLQQSKRKIGHKLQDLQKKQLLLNTERISQLQQLQEIQSQAKQNQHNLPQLLSQLNQYKQQIQYFKSKNREYQQRIAEQQAKFQNSQFDRELYSHSALLKLSETLQSKEAQLKQLQEEVAKFHAFPCTENEARDKVEGVREEVSRIEGILAHQMDSLATQDNFAIHS